MPKSTNSKTTIRKLSKNKKRIKKFVEKPLTERAKVLSKLRKEILELETPKGPNRISSDHAIQLFGLFPE